MPDLDYYRSLPYTYCFETIDEDERRPYWAAWVDELSGCCANGDTSLEALSNLQMAFDDYIKTMLKRQKPIPEPASRFEKKSTTRTKSRSNDNIARINGNDQVLSFGNYIRKYQSKTQRVLITLWVTVNLRTRYSPDDLRRGPTAPASRQS